MEKIICLNQGSGSAWDEFNKLLASGWMIEQMQAAGSDDGACCFVWLKKRKVLDSEYLTFDDESKKHLDEKTVKLLVDTFNRVYADICEFFNHGEILDVTYIVDPNYDGVAMASGGKVTVNPAWLKSHPWDIDCMTHELVHVAQNYGRRSCPHWITEGLADYGRAKFGLYNKEEGWSAPKYNEKQKYTDAYRVTAAFFIWLERHVDKTLPKDLNDTIKAGNYTEDYFVNKTGKTIDELWEMYANASKEREARENANK